MTKQQKFDKLNQLNDQIRECVYAIANAELDGERGEMMIERKRQLSLLKAQYKLINR